MAILPITEHEYRIKGGAVQPCTSNMAGPAGKGVIPVGDIALAPGELEVRVKAATGRNASAWLSNAQPFTVAVPSIIVAQDGFSGSAVDTNMWTFTNDNPTATPITVSGGTLNMAYNGGTTPGVNQLDLKAPFRINSGSFSFDLTKVNMTTTGLSPFVIQVFGSLGRLNIKESTVGSGGQVMMQPYNGNTKLGDYYASSNALMDGSSFKVNYNASTKELSMWHWRILSGVGGWGKIALAAGTDPLILDLGTALYIVIRADDGHANAAAGTLIKVDNVFVSNTDFSTRYPV